MRMLTCVCAVWFALALIAPAQAQEAACALDEFSPTRAVLLCTPGFSGERDRVIVYGAGLDPNADWPATPSQPLPELRSGYWVFDTGADNTANLVIRFTQAADGSAQADLFTDIDGDAMVDIDFPSEGMPQLTEAFPSISMVAPDGWWRDGNLVNYNIDLSVDGKIRGSFSISLMFTHPIWRDTKTDGTPEFLIHVRDEDRDGRPDYEWRQTYLDLPEESGYQRTEINYNTEDDEAPVQDFILWPHLGTGITGQDNYVKAVYGASIPPISIDWAISKPVTVREFVASRANAGNYFVYSTYRLRENETSIADFEAPFAFYNLTGLNTPVPDLLIRTAYTPPDSDFFSDGDANPDTRNRTAFQEMYYSWRYPTTDEFEKTLGPIWDYAMSLGGRHEYTSTVQVGPLNVIMPDYHTLPEWTIGSEWDFASLSADETANRRDSEAIPRWSVIEGAHPRSSLYITGRSPQEPFSAAFNDVTPGFRAELAPELHQTVNLYIDSLDGELHLQNVRYGVWRIDDTYRLDFANINRDPYIDQWTYSDNDAVLQQLTRTQDFIILQNGDTVEIKQLSLEPSLAEMLPPTNGDELTAIHETVAGTGIVFNPDRLDQRFSALEGSSWQANRVILSDLRLIPDGFEAIITVNDESSFSGTLALPIPETSTKTLLIRAENGQLTLTEAPSAALTLESIMIGAVGSPIYLSDSVIIDATLINESAANINNAKIMIEAQQGDQTTSILDSTADISGYLVYPIRGNWRPSFPGEWQLRLSIYTPETDTPVLLREQTVTVIEDTLQVGDYLTLWEEQPAGGIFYIALLGGVGLLVLCVASLLYRWIKE